MSVVSAMSGSAEREAVVDIIRRLVLEFDGSVPPDVVERCVWDVADRFDGLPVRTYVPVLVERSARTWLRDAVLQFAG